MKQKLLFIFLLLTPVVIFGQEDIHKIVDSLILGKNFDKAEQIAQEAVAKYPNNPEVLCALACVYRNKSYKEMVGVNTLSHLKDGESGSFGLTKNDVENIFSPIEYFEDSIFEKAEKIYHRIIEIDPHYKNAYMNLINSYETENNYEKYFAAVNLYIKNNKQLEEAKYILLELASKLYDKQKMDEVLKMYETIINTYPDCSEAISDIGAVYLTRGEFEKGKIYIEKSYALNPEDTLVIGNLVFVNIEIGNYADAYKYSRLLVSKAKSYFNNYTAGSMAVLTENTDADKFLNTFITIRKKEINKPEDDDFWIFAATKIKQMPIDTTALEQLIEQYYSNNYYNDAIITCEILLKKDNTNPYALQMLAATYEKLNNSAKVLKLLAQIELLNANEKIMPKNDLLYNYGRNYFIAKDYQKALNYLLKVKNEKLEIFINYLIGESYYHLNDKENAIAYHSKNSKLDDKDYMYYINLSINRLKELKKKLE